MTFPEDFPVTKRWPAQDPSVLQYYGFPTPNGVKVSIMLEETGLPYEVHRVSMKDGDVRTPEFMSISPNAKLPAIVDPNGPDGAPLAMFESGAILIYLAEKTGQLYGKTARDRHVINQWLMWQMGGVGPMIGQMGHFVDGPGAKVEDDYARTRYATEVKRLLTVLESQLAGKDWIAGEYSIADIAIGSWLRMIERYGAEDQVDWFDFETVHDYLDRFLDRPAVQRGLKIPSRDA